MRIYKNKKLLGTFRPYDGFFVPTIDAAKLLKMKKVMIEDNDIAKIISDGGSVFAKFVKPLDKIYPGEQIAVVDKRKNILNVGEALLNSEEMKQMKKGIAVRV